MSQTHKKRRFPFRRQKPQAPKANYAFIDSQNLNLGTQRAGWKMNWKRFRQYLKDEYNVEKAFMFIGYLPDNEDLYTQMQEAGYLVALKPTIDMFMTEEELAAEDHVTKGNVDTELVLYAMKELPNYSKAIIVSGDGDFYTLAEYLVKQKKLAHIMTPNWRYSTLLKPFEDKIIRLDQLKNDLAYRPHHKRGKGKGGSGKGKHQSHQGTQKKA